jgi:antitoxin component YwqK of YwqJK toxin-antitoxin module
LENEFEDIDFLISNQVALNNKYKIPGKMTFPINKQLYLVLEKVAELKDNQSGFFARTYLPFFKNFLKTQSFESLSLLMMASSDVDDIVKVVNKNIPELKKSRNIYVDLITNIKPTKSYELNGKKLNLKYWFDNDFNLDALGNVNALNKRIGDWIFFNSSGSVDMIGSYDENGNREGSFTSFDMKGDTINTFLYKNAKADGPYTLFNDGKVKEKGIYVNDLLEGIVTFYYMNGSLKTKDTFKNDKRNGAGVEYYYNGKVKFEYTYLNNELEGNFKEYNIYGELVMECNYLKGKYNGIYKEYYECLFR